MIFGFLRNRISRKEVAILRKAENSLGINFLDTYKTLSKVNRKKFLASAEYYNKVHADFLEAEKKYGVNNDKTK